MRLGLCLLMYVLFLQFWQFNPLLSTLFGHLVASVFGSSIVSSWMLRPFGSCIPSNVSRNFARSVSVFLDSSYVSIMLTNPGSSISPGEVNIVELLMLSISGFSDVSSLYSEMQFASAFNLMIKCVIKPFIFTN